MAERIFTREDAKSLIRSNTRSLKIPSDFTAIASGALAGFSQLEDLVIPEGITRISSYAFYVRSFKNTSNLKSLTLPSSLRQFDRWCFYDLNALESINVPEDFSEPLAMELFFQCPEATINFGKKLNIGKKVLFASKTKTVQHIMDEVGGILTLVSGSTLKVDDDWTLIIPPNFKVILTHAMRGVANKNVKRLVIPKTIKTISPNAFSFISTAEELVIEEGVEYIDSGAFAGCKGLKKITLPASLKKIGVSAFMNLPNLETITLPPDLEEVSDEMFSGCTSLRTVRFGKKITKIGAGAFSGCTALRGMILPESVKSIGNSAFWECLSLQRLYIPPACESLTQSSLGNCPLLTTLYMPRIIHDQQQTKRIFGDLTNPTITWVDKGSERPVWDDSELPDPEDHRVDEEEINEVPAFEFNLPSNVPIQAAFANKQHTADAADVMKIEQAILSMQAQIAGLTKNGAVLPAAGMTPAELEKMQKNLEGMKTDNSAATKLQESAAVLETMQKQLDEFAAAQETISRLEAMQEKVEAIGDVQAKVEAISGLQEKVEAISDMQAKVEAISGLQEKVEAIGDVQAKVEELSALKESVDKVGELQETVSAIHDAQEQIEALNQATETVETLNEAKAQIEAIPELQEKVEELSETVASVSGLTGLAEEVTEIRQKVEALSAAQEQANAPAQDIAVPETSVQDTAAEMKTSATVSGMQTAELPAAETETASALKPAVSLQESAAVYGRFDSSLPFTEPHDGEYPEQEAVFTHLISKPMPGPVERSAALKNYKVIAYRAFRGAEAGERFEIPEGVRRVERQAFWDCPRLMAIEIPSTLTEIEPDAFAGCTRMTDVYLPAEFPDGKAVELFLYRPEIKLHWPKKKILSRPRVVSVAELMDQFDQILTPAKAKKLTVRNHVLEIPEGYTTIAPNFAKELNIRADEPEHTLQTIFLPRSLRRITANAFAGLESVRHIVIQDGLQIVEMNAFTGCLGPFRLMLPDTVSYIGPYAFAAPCNFEQIRLPKHLRSLPENAFSNCNTLVSLRIPESVQEIGDFALTGCTNLATLTIPRRFEEQLPAIFDGPVKINVDWTEGEYNRYADQPTPEIMSVVVPSFQIAPEQRMFTLDISRACENFNERLKEMRMHPVIAPLALSEMSNQTKFEIPLGVVRLCSYAFGQNQRLMTLTVPKALTEFDYAAFYNCEKLRDVFLPEEFDRDAAAVLFMWEPSILVYFGNARPVRIRQMVADCPWILTSGDAAELDVTDGTMTVPQGYLVIASFMYHGIIGKTALRRFVIPETVKMIGTKAFIRTKTIEEIICQNGLRAVYPETFVECSGLKRVVLPPTLEFLGARAFVSCQDLEEIVIPKMFADRTGEILRECPRAKIMWSEDDPSFEIPSDLQISEAVDKLFAEAAAEAAETAETENEEPAEAVEIPDIAETVDRLFEEAAAEAAETAETENEETAEAVEIPDIAETVDKLFEEAAAEAAETAETENEETAEAVEIPDIAETVDRLFAEAAAEAAETAETVTEETT
ncbi:MAG: leucine-rich repeat protein, partial [Oscillospiraceae bacterium]|nr:leucine-rich repeat protein [Oscillospiraceae bacterium]